MLCHDGAIIRFIRNNYRMSVRSCDSVVRELEHTHRWLLLLLYSERTGSGKSDMDLGGGSVLPQPKMAEKRRTDEQTSTQEPFSGIQGEGGFGGDPGREDFGGVGRTV
jgi:hypothetical protein